jgi:hypothetical protein
MSESSPTWNSELYGILLHPSELRVLMMWGAAGWSLPQLSLDEAVREADVGKVSEAMRLTDWDPTGGPRRLQVLEDP